MVVSLRHRAQNRPGQKGAQNNMTGNVHLCAMMMLTVISMAFCYAVTLTHLKGEEQQTLHCKMMLCAYAGKEALRHYTVLTLLKTGSSHGTWKDNDVHTRG